MMRSRFLDDVPLFCQYGLANNLEEMLAMPAWQYFRLAKSIQRDRVSEAVSMTQAIGVAMGGGKEVVKRWEAVLAPEVEEPKAIPKRTEASKKRTIQRLAQLFGSHG